MYELQGKDLKADHPDTRTECPIMTESGHPWSSQAAYPPPIKPPKKRLGFLPGWRIFTYVILLFNLVMLAWIIGGSISASNSPNHCGSKQTNRFFTHHDCVQAAHAGKDIGTGIAVAALIFLWVAGDVILGIIWLVTRSSKRSCPVCGNGVKKNIVVCPNCNFDFRSLQQPAPGMRQAQPQPQTPYPADAPAEASTSVTKPRQAVAVASRPPSAGPAVTNSDISQDDRLAELVAQVTPRVIRQWAIEQGIEVRPQGRIPKDVLLAYFAHNG